MDYEQKYKESLKRATALYENANGMILKKWVEQVFPELKENKDEDIREWLIRLINTAGYRELDSDPMPCTRRELVEWLEKQGKQKNDAASWPNLTNCIRNCRECDAKCFYRKEERQKPVMIQWKGDNLREVVNFTGKSPKFGEWFKDWEEYENYVKSHNNIFKLFYEDGSHYEVPVGAWIVRTPDMCNVASKATFISKPTEGVESKFKVGDWIVSNSGILRRILQVSENGYESDHGWSSKENYEKCFRLWTVKDVKPGDVLANEHGSVFINASYDEETRGTLDCYCYLSVQGEFCVEEHKTGSWYYKNEIHPATQEQRDTLFNKMKEAGYQWDAVRMELKKIETKPVETNDDFQTRLDKIAEYLRYKGYGDDADLIESFKSQPKADWSDEDCERIARIADFVWKNRKGDTSEIYQLECDANWLKTINPTHWKPSEKQMAQLKMLFDGEFESVDLDVAESLYNDLKKL